MFVPGKSSVEVQSEVFDIFFVRKLDVVYVDRWWWVVNVTRADLDPLAFILHVLSHFLVASGLACSFRDAMVGSLSVAITAVSSAKVAEVVSGEVGRPAVYIRSINGPRTLP
jgi:hypothetical protein